MFSSVMLLSRPRSLPVPSLKRDMRFLGFEAGHRRLTCALSGAPELITSSEAQLIGPVEKIEVAETKSLGTQQLTNG
jgi:hypothetical protein